MRTGILEFLGGLGLFLFGIRYLEKAVSGFAKGGFKKLIKKFTANNFSSLVTGLISTVIVQSSNLVSVLVLAFVGTGILTLTGALAVMLGSNIGTTIPDALFGSIGLTYDIKIFTFPLIFIGAIMISFFSRYEKVAGVGRALIGLALIFLALAYMKSGLLFVTEMVDFSQFMNMSPRFFFGVGFLLTLLVQSGGATFIIALTSLSSGLITIDAALPIIFGGYLGSTVTIVLAALGPQPAIKKQVALGHVSFNFLVAMLGMITLPWIKWFFIHYAFPYLGEVRTLALFYVGFRTLVALLVFPFLNFFSQLFQKYITDKQNNFALAVQKIDHPVDMEVAILAIKQDLLVYFKEVVGYNLNIWDFYLTDVTEEVDIKKLLLRNLNFGKTHLKKEYQEIKTIQETLLSFLANLNQNSLQKPEESEQITSLYQVVIDIGDSSKYLKDVWERVEDWQWSTSEQLQKDYEVLRKIVLDFYQKIMQVLANLDNRKSITILHELLEQIQKNDKKYIRMYEREGNDLKLANLIQVNRYFSLSCMSLVRAIEGVSLTAEEKKYLKDHIKELF